MAIVKSAKQTKKKKPAKPASKAKRRRVRIQPATAPVPREILETPGPAFPGIVEILLEGRNR